MLWFSNDDRGLVLNKSNNRTLRGAFDDDTANWVGKVIAVFPMMTEFRGKMVPALRVRIPPPKEAAASPSNGAAPVADPEIEPAPVKSAQRRHGRRDPVLSEKPRSGELCNQLVAFIFILGIVHERDETYHASGQPWQSCRRRHWCR